MTKQETERIVTDEYNKSRSVLFTSTISPANLQVDVVSDERIVSPNEVCAYFPDENKIRMLFTETEIVNDYAMKGSTLMGQEPVWKAYLLHEIIHEYQFKCVKSASDEGKELMKESKRQFPGKGHDETFYTAICECAPKLGLNPKILLESI